MTVYQFLVIAAAAVAGGAVNAMAGGGTLITFPMLTAVGLPAVVANVTNTVALCPGYVGGAWVQLKDLRDQRHLLLLFLPVSVAGGIAGGALLLFTGEGAFRRMVPYLILSAAALLAAQGPVRRLIISATGHRSMTSSRHVWAMAPLFGAAVYGGYFGAGLSVIVLAVLGLILDDTLNRLNVLKQAISFSVNIAAAVFFLFSGNVVWSAALVMAAGAVVGGMIGGRISAKVNPTTLRWVVVTVGVLVGCIYLVR